MSIKAADNDAYRISWPADRKITLVMQIKEPMKQATGGIKLESRIIFRIPINTRNAQISKTIGSVDVADCTDNENLVILRNACAF